MSTIQTTFTSNDSSVVKSLQVMQARHDSLIAKQKQLAAEAAKGGAAAVAAFEKNAKAIYNVELSMLRLKATEEKRAAAEKKYSDDAKRRIEEVTRKLQEQSARKQQDADKTKAIMAEQIGQFKNMVGGLFSVQAAVGLVTKAYEKWDAVMEKASERHKKLTADMVKEAAAGGDLPRMKEIEHAARTAEGATPEAYIAAFGGVREAAPGMDFERRKELAEKAAQVEPTGMDVRQFGKTVGAVADFFPTKTADDIAQIARHLSQQAGVDIGNLAEDGFQRAVKTLAATGAVSQEEALGFGLEAMKADIGTKPLEKLAARLSEQPEMPRMPKGRALTDQEREHRAYAAEENPRARFAKLLESKPLRQQVLGPETAQKINLIPFADAFEQGKTLQQVQVGEHLPQIVREMEAGPGGLERLQAHNTEIDQARADEHNGPERSEINAAFKQLLATLEDRMTGWKDIGAIFDKGNQRVHPTEYAAQIAEFLLRSKVQTGSDALRDTVGGAAPGLYQPTVEELPAEVQRFIREQEAINRERQIPVPPKSAVQAMPTDQAQLNDPNAPQLRAISDTLRDTNQVEDLQEQRLREIIAAMKVKPADPEAPEPKQPAVRVPAKPEQKNPTPLGDPERRRNRNPVQERQAAQPIPPWFEQGPVRPEPTVPHFDAEHGILFEPPRPPDADPQQWDEMAAAARGKFRDATGVDVPRPLENAPPPPPLTVRPPKAKLPDVPELPATQERGMRLPPLKAAVADPNWLRELDAIASAAEAKRATPHDPTVAERKKVDLMPPGLRKLSDRQRDEKDARAQRAAERKESGGMTKDAWDTMLNRNNAARAREASADEPRTSDSPPLTIAPPRVNLAEPDQVAVDIPAPRYRLPDIAPLDVSRPKLVNHDRFDALRMPANRVETIDVPKVELPQAAPQLAPEAFAAALANAVGPARSDSGLLPVLQQMATTLKAIADSTGATKVGIDRLAGGGSRPGVNARALAAASAANMHMHSETG